MSLLIQHIEDQLEAGKNILSFQEPCGDIVRKFVFVAGTTPSPQACYPFFLGSQLPSFAALTLPMPAEFWPMEHGKREVATLRLGP